ncbi:16631_t:CDS:2, partial [Gigaspora margarita]
LKETKKIKKRLPFNKLNMDSSSEPVNHEDTLVSPSADANKNNLDCMIIPEISLQKRKLYTNDASGEVGDDILELSSEEIVPTGFYHSGPSTNKKFLSKKNKGKKKLQRQPPDPFRNCGLKIAPGTNNIFDLMHPQKQKNTDYNNDTPNVSVGSSNTTTRKKASRSLVCSPAWKWFEKVYIDNIRYGMCNIEKVDRKACGTKVKTGDSTIAL